ncbi:unnamed protein product [Paramecium octaurelia]|uniref:Uncharacterized protein n=1 Tax=Paramecium octaurelia TaxID=43137 RepID=A0A8S1XLF5_PAROT|nr:unnamed protein product [Paramecium octaurelia]
MNKEQYDQEKQPILIEKDNSFVDWETLRNNTISKKIYYKHNYIGSKLIQQKSQIRFVQRMKKTFRNIFNRLSQKNEDSFDELNLIISTMSRMLKDYKLNPEEVQQNSRVICQEDSKKFIENRKRSFKLKKQQKTKYNRKLKYKREYQLNDYLSIGMNQASHVLNKASTLHQKLQGQEYRVASIERKVTDYIQQFEGMNQLKNRILNIRIRANQNGLVQYLYYQ